MPPSVVYHAQTAGYPWRFGIFWAFAPPESGLRSWFLVVELWEKSKYKNSGKPCNILLG